MATASLTWLPASIVERIQQAADEITRAMGDHVEAIVLVGAAVHADRHDRARMPELLVVASEASVDDLHALAEHVHDSMRQGLRLRILTHEELERSADVFTVELAEYKAHHVVIAGSDPFDGVTWSRADLRRSVEQGLRGIGRRVRNRVLSGMGSDGRRDDPQLAVAQGIDRFVTLARHALAVLGADVPRADAQVIEAIGDATGADIAGLRQHLERIRLGKRIADPIDAAVELGVVVERVTTRIDQLGTGG